MASKKTCRKTTANYHLVKELTSLKQGRTFTIQDKAGKCLTEEQDILKRWTGYCSELYTNTTTGDPKSAGLNKFVLCFPSCGPFRKLFSTAQAGCTCPFMVESYCLNTGFFPDVEFYPSSLQSALEKLNILNTCLGIKLITKLTPQVGQWFVLSASELMSLTFDVLNSDVHPFSSNFDHCNCILGYKALTTSRLCSCQNFSENTFSEHVVHGFYAT